MAGLALVLPEHMTSVAFFDPVVALDYVNTPPGMPTLADRCFSAASDAPHALFRLNIDLIEEEMNVLQRFNRLSVVVVDYSMPGLNGLQFCEQIKDPQIGKVLLTGVADEKMAVEAFNAGIIDRFISKSHPQASEHISDFSREMQHAYFRRQTQQMHQTLRLAGPLFLDDHSVTNWVRRQMTRNNFCVSEAQGDAQADFAEQHGAPAKLVAKLRDHSHVGFFLEDPASYGGGEFYPWDELLHRATTLGESPQKWLAAVVSEPPLNIDYAPEAVCQEAWLRLRNLHRPRHASLLKY